MGIHDLLDSLDPLARALVDIPTELFYDYLANMEGFLEIESRKYLEKLEAMKREVESGELTEPSYCEQVPAEVLIMEYVDYQLQQTKDFENILRRSFFVTIFGFLESRLLADCRSQLSKREDVLLSLGDIRGSGIDKAKICMKKVLQVPFDTVTHWGEIKKYKLLRNCIVHNEGRLDEGFSDDKNTLRSYVRGKEPLLSLSPSSEIILSKDFCREALDTVTKFLVPELFGQEAA